MLTIPELAARDWVTPKQAALVTGMHDAETWRALALDNKVEWRYRGPKRVQIVLHLQSCREHLLETVYENRYALPFDSLERLRAVSLATLIENPNFPHVDEAYLAKYCRKHGLDVDDFRHAESITAGGLENAEEFLTQ